jgi:hypothetical protein
MDEPHPGVTVAEPEALRDHPVNRSAKSAPSSCGSCVCSRSSPMDTHSPMGQRIYPT